jgi:tetratricopeptide (TPR) repeat protein
VVEHRVGSYYVTVPQDYRRAVPHLRRALDLFEAAARDDPADGRTQMQISMQSYLLAICWLNLRDLPAAETYAQRAVDIRRLLHAADPQDARVRDGFAAAHRLLGDVEVDWKPASARRHYQSALTLLAGFDPPNLTRVQATRAHSYLGIGRLEAKRGNKAAACTAFAEACNAFQKIGEHRMSVHERKEAQSAATAYASCLPSDGKAAGR